MVMPWGNSIFPAPKDLRKFPFLSNSITGSSLEPAQSLTPQRSATQILPLLSTATALDDPMVRPAGSLKKSRMVRYGLGWELGAFPASASAVPPSRSNETRMGSEVFMGDVP